MKTIRLSLLALMLAMTATTSFARDSVSFSLSLGYPAYFYPGDVYYSPPPPVVYYEPAPVYYGYYEPRGYISYYDPGFRYDYRHWRRHDWRDHDRHDHRWDRR